MANLKEIRSRISSISSTMKITSAMKMVSAAKLKKAQDRMTNIKPYSSGISTMIQNLLPSVNLSEIELVNNFCSENKVLIIPISSNRGLCGGFNANVFKAARKYNKSQVEVFAIGKKSIELFKRNNYKIISNNIDVIDASTASICRLISEKIINDFIAGKWSKVEIIYNQFKNTATQIVQTEQLLPITIDNDDKNIGIKDYIFEPNKSTIINELMPNKIHTHFFEAVLNSVASEHGARMTAMHKATDNANELKQDLTLSYNRQRQAAITNEILEIVAGAEALQG